MIFETARLRLRAIRPDEADHFASIADDYSVASMLAATFPHPYTVEQAHSWIGIMQERHDAGQPRSFAFARKDDDVIIGGGGLDGHGADDNPALGYWLGAAYRGFHYAEEAVAALVKIGFDHYAFPVIGAIAGTDNPASQKAIERAGLKHIGEIKQAPDSNRRGHTDFINYRLTLAEWKELRP